MKAAKGSGKAMKSIADIVQQKHGTDIGHFSNDFLADTALRRMKQVSIPDILDYMQLLESSSMERQQFVDSLYVSWSDFCREPVTFSILEKVILPEIIGRKKSGQQIRIWSVGCAKGQEPYSIAMLTEDLLKKKEHDLSLRIFATDISTPSLQKAQAGIYESDEMGNLPLKWIKNYFDKADDRFSVCSKIKERVAFSYYDIFDIETNSPPESIYGEFDLIFCRNLLIYYNEASQKHIVEKLKLSLSKEGYLVVGETEQASVAGFSKLKQVCMSTAILKN